MVAFLIGAGEAYTDRRDLQSLADSSALAAALKIGRACDATQESNSTAEADRIIGLTLGPHDGATPSASGGCGPGGYTVTYTYQSSAYTATMVYPYNSDDSKFAVSISHNDSVRAFPSFLTPGQYTVVGRAVAQFRAGMPSGNFAIFAQSSVGCQGASQIVAQGSIYSHDLPTGNGQCKLYARAVKDSSGNYLDYGNFMVYADGMGSWACVHFCADGYELAGHTSGICGTTGSTQYLSGAQTGNPNPCASTPPPVPNLSYPPYPDPNTTCSNCSTPYYRSYSAPFIGCDPSPSAPDVNGYLHYSPGCYSTVDVTGQKAILDPGFYYIGVNGGQGVCLGGNGNLLGKDVTLEFVGGANFTSIKCGLNGACGSGCGFGADPSLPAPDPPSTASYFSAPDSSSVWCAGTCPLKGLLIYRQPSATGTWLVKGPAETSWFKGSIFWPGTCEWWANGTGTILGQLVCNTVYLQGGAVSSGAGVQYPAGVVNQQATEAALVE
jgi:hypothetical protein